ncbi:fumarylacetoacetase [Paracoccaceae bacterium]|nr:fumarylacetoacetase [Paracoccaceae bacterium]
MSMELIKSFVTTANNRDCDFPLNNLPFGVCFENDKQKCFSATAIGDQVLNLTYAEELDLIPNFGFKNVLLNSFMSRGSKARKEIRKVLQDLLSDNSKKISEVEKCLVPFHKCDNDKAFNVSEYTDFYSCKNHAVNASKIIRGENAELLNNWYNLPVAYNGRASSVHITGCDIRRPTGQIFDQDSGTVKFELTRKLDFELEVGTVIGGSLPVGETLDFEEAENLIFGYVLLNDWSARDIQSWEYQPLGPFLSKSFGTSISHWIITPEALEPFKRKVPERKLPLLPHFEDDKAFVFDISLNVTLIEEDGSETEISRTNSKELYYSPVQQVIHHSSGGCGISTGDLMGSGTISGTEKGSFGCMLELSWGGRDKIVLSSGKQRDFLEDNDTIVFKGSAMENDFKIGFGSCSGRIVKIIGEK